MERHHFQSSFCAEKAAKWELLSKKPRGTLLASDGLTNAAGGKPKTDSRTSSDRQWMDGLLCARSRRTEHSVLGAKVGWDKNIQGRYA